ncbi:MAG: alginate export family protein [Candidatus Eisenbacteria bacterium]|nr:alginate export family protein [Candidatus Eisenbacteria bacterium]
MSKRRSAFFALWILAGISVLLPATVLAETKLTVSGQVRVRSELDKKSFEPAASPLQFNDLRARLGIEAVVDANTHVFVQFQDSRRLGGVSAAGEYMSGTTNDAKNVDLHQGYLLVDRLGVDGLGMQAGRYEINLGNQRVFGANDWSNVGRTWEGFSLSYKAAPAKVTAHALKVLEPSAKKGVRDFDIVGLYGQIPETGLDLFGFYERNAERIQGGDDPDLNLLDRFNVGGYYKKSYGLADVEANAVYQFGDQGLKSPVMEQDISAYLVTAEVGYARDCPHKPRIALGIDYASGDKDPNDDTYGAYVGPYATVHRIRGYMDYFRVDKPEGLADLMLRLSMEPAPGWTLKADGHYFMAAADYEDYQKEMTKDVGFEVDLTATTTKIAGLKAEGGFSVFFPSKSFANEIYKLRDPEKTDPGVWAYLMLTAGFGKDL